MTASGSSTVQRCSFSPGINVLISLLSSWLKIERRAAHRENHILVLLSHSRDSGEDHKLWCLLPPSLLQIWPCRDFQKVLLPTVKLPSPAPKPRSGCCCRSSAWPVKVALLQIMVVLVSPERSRGRMCHPNTCQNRYLW